MNRAIDHAARRRLPAATWLVVGAGIVSAFQVGKVPVALDALRADLALPLAAASWMLSAFGAVGALGGIAAGALVDRLGARRLVIGGLLLQALAGVAGVLASSSSWLLATRTVEGLGFLAVIVAAPVLIGATAPAAMAARAFAAWSTFMPVGMSIALLAGPWVLPAGWRVLWVANAVLLAVAAIALSAGTGADTRAGTPAPSASSNVRATIASPAAWLLGGLFALYSAAYFAVFGFLPTVLVDRGGVGMAAAGALTAIAVVAGALGNLAAGALLGRGHAVRHLLGVSFVVLAACGLGVFAGALPAWLAYACCFVFSLVGGVIPATLLAGAAGMVRGSEAGTMTGWLMQSNNAGLVAGPALAGWIAGTWGWPGVSALAAALCLAGAAWACRLGAPAAFVKPVCTASAPRCRRR